MAIHHGRSAQFFHRDLRTECEINLFSRREPSLNFLFQKYIWRLIKHIRTSNLISFNNALSNKQNIKLLSNGVNIK